jgi:hypothetical protein
LNRKGAEAQREPGKVLPQKGTKMKLPKDESKAPITKLALLIWGLFWICIGVTTLFKPVYYFRGAFIDFTGYNVQVGTGLIILGIALMAAYFKRTR